MAPRPRWRRVRAVSFIAFFALPAALLVANIQTASLWPWIAFATLGVTAVGVDLLWLFRHAIEETPPYRCIQRSFSIEMLPAIGGLREAPRRPALVLDGHPVECSGPPRVLLTRSGAEGPGARYHVSILAEAGIVRLDTLRSRDSAHALAEEVGASLGLAPMPVEPHAEDITVPWHWRLIVALVEFGGVVSATRWCSMIDCADRVGLSLALAGLVVCAALVVGRRIGLRIVQSIAAQAARETYGVLPSGLAHGRFSDTTFGICVIGAVLAMGIAGTRIGAPDLPDPTRFCWVPETPRICRADVNNDGVPEAIGMTCGPGGWDLSAIDAKTGTRVPFLANTNARAASPLYCEYPSFFVMGSWIDGKNYRISAHHALLESRTNKPLWEVTIAGEVTEILRNGDCALVHADEPGTKGAWSGYSFSTGEPCKSIAEPISADFIDRVRREQQLWQPEQGKRVVDGIVYALTEAPSPPRLTLSASRGNAVLWMIDLRARPVEGLPMAVAQGTIVVAATDLRTGDNLRLIGVDAADGRIRYVHLHPAKKKVPIDVAVAGPMVLIWSGQLAGIVPSSGRVAWITHKE